MGWERAVQDRARSVKGLENRKWRRPCHFPPPQIQAVSEILENGEETPGPGPSLDRMLSSSSSVSSLNSTVRERKARRVPAASPPHILTRSPCLTPPSPLNLTLQPPGKLPRSAFYLVSSLCPPCSLCAPRPRCEPTPHPYLPPSAPATPAAERQPDEPVGGGGGGRRAGARLRALRVALRAGCRRAARARDSVPEPGCGAAPPLRPVSAPPRRAGSPESSFHRPAPPLVLASVSSSKCSSRSVPGRRGLSEMTPVKLCTRPGTGSCVSGCG